MYICRVNVRATLASFRIPETQTFHQTLPLPPITTLIGLMGAAIGLSYEDAYNFAIENRLFFGVTGTSNGSMKDLWNYRKFTSKEKKFTPEDVAQRKNYSIVLKEYLYKCEFNLYYGCTVSETMERIVTGFYYPHYPLSAGSSDDLLKVISVERFEKDLGNSRQFRDTVIEGDLRGQYEVSDDIFNKPIYDQIKSPRTFSLPVKFEFEGQVRKVKARRSYTFIGDRIELKDQRQCLIYDGENVELYTI